MVSHAGTLAPSSTEIERDRRASMLDDFNTECTAAVYGMNNEQICTGKTLASVRRAHALQQYLYISVYFFLFYETY